MGARLATLGTDPVWPLWRDWAAARGVEVVAYPVAESMPLLVSPWDEPPLQAVRRAVAAVGTSSDVWLVMTGPSAALVAEVLAAGGRGCLARVPDDGVLPKVLAVSAWWPRLMASEVVDMHGSGSGVAVGPPVAPSGRKNEKRRQWTPWRPRPNLRRGLQLPRDQPPKLPSPEPDPAKSAASAPLVVLGPWPLGDEVPQEVLDGWLRAPAPDMRAHGAEASCLGCVPPPVGGRWHPAVAAAARARRVAVVTTLEWPVLGAARALIGALRANGGPDLEIWLSGARPSPTVIRQVSLALGAPCRWVPRAGGVEGGV